MNRVPTDNHSDRDLERVLGETGADEAAGLREAWDIATETTPDFSAETAGTHEAWHRLDATLDGADDPAEAGSARPAVVHRRAFLRRVPAPRAWVAYAAAAVVVVAMIGGISWRNGTIEHLAPAGERLAVELPDGSTVEMNAGSRLRHTRRFGAERRIHLDGEAFFDVAHGDRLFVVKTFNAEVAVLGTRFNVRAWPGDQGARTTVALVAGRVALTPAGQPSGQVQLEPGDTRVVSAHGTAVPAVSPLSTEDAVAWRAGDMVFKDEYVGAILADVERRFGVSVALMDSDHARRRLNVALRGPGTPEDVLSDLAPALGLAYRETASGFELYAPRP